MRSLRAPLAVALLTALKTFLVAVDGFTPAPSSPLVTNLRTKQQLNHNHGSSAICSAGKGWDSDDYLKNLGGNGGDPEAAAQEYQKRQQQREAMLKRQRASMSPEALKKAQAFLQERQAQLYAEAGEDNMQDDQDDFIRMNIPTNSQGGSRFQQMMMQQQTLKDRMRMQQQQQQQGGGPGGFEQKFAPIPLEDDEEENKED